MAKLNKLQVLTVFAVSLVAAPAFASDPATVDVTGAVAIIGGITVAIAAIGAAKLAPAATAVAFKWAKGALFS
ncbi:major capsid protein [Photobacterium sp. GB-56]|uniref:major capsid protein n=1 Tax=Photobacterium sp. GB-56 TaxID=2022106 RepID=UPI000D181A1A|nr:major capsid protein [Photobacterium sp. GB-56]PSV27089.1 hypothetical protein C9J42_09485 [Photobacterium sp. GB-56]